MDDQVTLSEGWGVQPATPTGMVHHYYTPNRNPLCHRPHRYTGELTDQTPPSAGKGRACQRCAGRLAQAGDDPWWRRRPSGAIVRHALLRDDPEEYFRQNPGRRWRDLTDDDTRAEIDGALTETNAEPPLSQRGRLVGLGILIGAVVSSVIWLLLLVLMYL